MEEMGLYQGLTVYGPLGIFTAYYMIKDWTMNKELRKTIGEFKEVLIVLKEKVR